ncbi:unnamed protein product [marine sediment metagenome]|uniref:Uncharacterized protein n=1 Tax=marine sediment metagenome TaxID=412755 RepID=X1J8Y1_9ZZZZ
MPTLMDKARELVSVAEGEILKKEATILALRRELVKVRGELAASRQQQHAVRSVKCQGCTYKVIALKALDEEGVGKKADLIREGV